MTLYKTIDTFIGNDTSVIVQFTYEKNIVIINAVWTNYGDNLLTDLNKECLDKLEAACLEQILS